MSLEQMRRDMARVREARRVGPSLPPTAKTTLQQGPRGGFFYVNLAGNKVYLHRKDMEKCQGGKLIGDGGRCALLRSTGALAPVGGAAPFDDSDDLMPDAM